MSDSAKPMAVIDWRTATDAERRSLLDRGRQAIFSPELRESVEAIIKDVASNGDEAVCRATLKWDGCELEPERLPVSESEIEDGAARVPQDLRTALRVGIDHVRRFNGRVLERAGSWRTELDPGLTVGEKSTPIAGAGLFVPSGKGSYPSVLVQIGTPAVVAGVPEITVTVPPKDAHGEVDPAVLFVAKELGLHQVFRANGPAGIAAMALGTDRFPRAWKVLGPGSPPVAAAQIGCQRYGCSTVMLLGPSESLILADASADPTLLAADLLNEAEHGPDSASVLVTPSTTLVDAAQAEIAAQLARLPAPRAGYASAALRMNGGAVLVKDIEAAIDVANQYAPEHMQVVCAEAEAVVEKLTNAGEVLIGQETPISAANYVLGVPAALPTGGFAHVSSGVTAEAFLKKTSIARASTEAIAGLARSVSTLAEYEDFPAHAEAVRVRHGEGVDIPPIRGEVT